MGHFRITESERREILNLHNNAKLIKEQATSGTMDRATLINKIQSTLKTKYNANLGATGPNKDGVDGNLGPKTVTAIKAAMASKKPDAYDTAVNDVVTGQQQPAQAQSGTSGTAQQPAQSGTSGTAQQPAQPIVADRQPLVAPAAPQSIPVTNPSIQPAQQQPQQQTQLTQQSQQALAGQLTPQQIRQQGRFDQRLARQARRNERRAGQQGQE
jgi:hypothetical protein